MPFNPSGVFVRLYNWVSDRDNDIPIDSARMDAEMNGMADALTAIVAQTQPFTGPMVVAPGTFVTPGVAFSNDTNTGIYRDAADSLGFAGGGVKQGAINTNGLQLRANGNEANPAIQFDSANNGIFWVLGGGPRFTAAGVTIGRIEGGSDLPSTVSLVTRVAGDARYVSYPSLENGFEIPTGGSFSTPAIQFGNINNGIYWELGSGPRFAAGGGTIARLDGGTSLATAEAIVTRQSGDARYCLDTTLAVRTRMAEGSPNQLGVACQMRMATGTVAPNDTVAGSALVFSNGDGSVTGSAGSGTWRALCIIGSGGAGAARVGSFMRIT
ncbi:hypothetical protein [Paracoccus sp. PAR01]|uniref:hypothetical protein n=1 Tax=Paracoccus sp. PAR01 TaxID=2769282 RepID=UPI00177F3C3A|nr:hypothetical protein [Paracoccus sp. PAR01]MBD9528968.1 hypothetical protein [Paracoccus sp. PAR01]